MSKKVELTDPVAKKNRKRKKAKGKQIVTVLAVLLVIASILFMVLMGRYVYRQLFADTSPTVSVDLRPFDHTPEQDQSKVAYYAVGLLGAESSDPLTSLMLVCHDKQAGTLSLLQIPSGTYIADETLWGDVHTAGMAFAAPKPYDWCDVCKQRLYGEQILDGKHTTCGTPVSQRAGSAVLSLMDVFNDQFGMPVDHYFLLPQQAIVKLADLLDGLTVQLETSITVDDLTYAKGKQTIDGEAALYYMTHTDTAGIRGELELLPRQRTVTASLLQALFAQDEAGYEEDTIAPLQNGSTPIRSDLDADDMIALMMQLRQIPLDKIAVYTLPGTVSSAQSVACYSVDRTTLAELLNAQFNPVGRAVTVTDIRAPELTDTRAETPEKKMLAEYLPAEDS